MRNGNDSRQDSTRELMEEWNLASDEEPSHHSLVLAGPAVALPCELGLDNAPAAAAELEADDSFPAGPTLLCQAFVPMSPRPDGPGSSCPAGGNGSAGVGAGGKGRSGKKGAGTRPTWPRCGDELGGFRLVVELGRGAFARVFLAEEMNLGRRLVALKVSRAEGDEPRILARLQHAHIVPVHSVQDEPATGLRLLCMPFFGGANLAQLLQEAWELTHTQATGRSLMEALDQFSQRLPAGAGQDASLGLGRVQRPRLRSLPASTSPSVSEPVGIVPAESPRRSQPGTARTGRLRSLVTRLVSPRNEACSCTEDPDDGQPSRRFLRGASSIQAAVWIVARLAEGLDHAHSRGLLHRDLKPANILIAGDGTPMLLDFNLAAPTDFATEAGPGDQSGEPVVHRALLGGTLPYMAPEHLDAFDPEGATSPEAIEERSDLYALGLILFEMISGNHPFPEPPPGLTPVATIRCMKEDRRRRPAPSLRGCCPEVPWSLDALVSQCLDPDPDRRYRNARDLAEDLRRFLEDLPMKHCPEPSLRERLGKWARRHPGLCGSTTIALVALVLLGLMTVSVMLVYDGMLDLAARMKLQAFDRGFIDSQFLLNVAGRNDEFLKKGTRTARKLLGQVGIADETTAGRAGGRRARDAGQKLPAQWLLRLEPEEARRLWRQIVELLILEARAGVIVASHGGSEDDRRGALIRAISHLDQAERLDTALPSVLFAERARYHTALGDADLAARDRVRAAQIAPTQSRDLTMLGTSLLASGDTAGAEVALRAAIAQDATSLWAWFAMGHCHFEQGRYLEAAGDFSACVACGPEYAWSHFNRALALARAGRLLDAKVSYDRALELDPDLVEARVDRALVELELDRTEEALADLRTAVAAGRREPGVLSALGETLARLGRRDEAEAMFRDLLTSHPDNVVARVARGMTRLDRDPPGARQDFTDALDKDPRNALAHYGMARLTRTSDPQGAVKHLDAALESDPHLVDAVQLRALVRARLGDRAMLDDVDFLVKAPTAQRLYNAACALAVYADTARDPRPVERSIQLLELAFKAGFSTRIATADPDLKTIRSRPDFARLIARF
ncbi:MAG: protein kinase domain-containing protein [Isosphaeraceae bacterium]